MERPLPVSLGLLMGLRESVLEISQKLCIGPSNFSPVYQTAVLLASYSIVDIWHSCQFTVGIPLVLMLTNNAII